jgi:RNA polymerase sigma factor (sigma-70 family)
MSMQAEDPSNAEEAWEEFFYRHRAYVLGVCRRFQNVVGEAGAEDLAQETLIRVYRKAHTFKPLANGNPDHARARIRAWMGQIANRLFLSALRRTLVVDPIDELSDVPLLPPVQDGHAPGPLLSERRRLIAQALRTLTERERDVLLASFAWYELDGGCHRMPSEELATLKERFQTTAVNIRQIRARAFDKVQRYIDDQTK